MSYSDDESISSDMDNEREFEIMDEFSEEYSDYLKKAVKDELLELEVIYGTKSSVGLTKEQFIRCIKNLTVSEKYVTLPEDCSLDIRCQQVFRGKKVLTNIRASVLGLLNVKRYCMSESLEGLDVKMIKKTINKDEKGKTSNTLFCYPYNLRMNLKKEIEVNHFSNNEALLIKKKWKMMNKYFRYKKRYSFKSKNGLFRIDLTCVKQNKIHPRSKSPIYTKTFKEAEVLKSPEKYELEVEYIGSQIPEEEIATFTPKSTPFEDFIANMNTSINYYNTISPFCSTGDNLVLESFTDFSQDDIDDQYLNDEEPEYAMNSPTYSYSTETFEPLPEYVNINVEYLNNFELSFPRDTKFIPFEKRSNYKPESLSVKYKANLKVDDYYHVNVMPPIMKDDISIDSLWVPIGYTEVITHHYIEKPVIQNVERFNDSAYEELTGVLEVLLKELLQYVENTSFLMEDSEKLEILGRYVRTIDDDQYFNRTGYRMIGPQPVTLSLSEMNINNPHSILQGYVVTEKADGIRAQLIVCKEDKRAYIVTSKKGVIDTGISFEGVNENWIFDGEYITKDKYRNDIKLFMIFDVYQGEHEGTKELFNLPWISLKRDSKSRSVALHNFFKNHEKSSDGDDVVRIETKIYIEGASKLQKKKGKDEYSNLYTTLKACKRILDKCNEEDGGYEYETDGLIFLPMFLPVKGSDVGEKVSSYNGTWNYNYKWKPPEENTIDFRVTFDKDKRFYTYNKTNEDGTIQKIQYRKVVLTVGYKEKDDTFIDFNMKFINNEKPNNKRFLHFNRGIDNLHICNVPLKNGKVVCSRDKLEITEGCIVEMRYNGINNDGFNWTPLRVRTDKEYPQWFSIADNIWKTIINPVSESMITGEEELIIEDVIEKNEYYVSDNTSDNSTPIRHLHNFIKSLLIEDVVENSGKDISILDTSCGRGGDNQKYLRVNKKKKNIRFILGLDISDNIKEAANRYYYESLKSKVPRGIFLQFDTSKNIKKVEGSMNETCDDMLSIIFGKKDSYDKKYDKFYKDYNSLGKRGFDVISSQFSFHYYFKNEETLRGYLQNLKELVKPGGYFMGTCYDGMKVFKSFSINEGKNIQGRDSKETLIYEIIKDYDISNFDYDKEDTSNMFGQEINVYMSSIGQYITEYLVNFEFVIDIMKEYGFEPHYPDKASNMKKPIGNFEEIIDKIDTLLDDTEKDVQKAYLYAKVVQKDEIYRKLSGLNNWFIFKKI
jgi:SAM-dependent methyltransferase